MKEKLAVCFGVTSDLAFAACVTIKNFVDLHGHEGVRFIIFSDGPLAQEKRALAKLGIELDVRRFRPPLSWLILWSSRAIGYFSPLVLSKFEAFNLLNDFKRVLWLDYDIVIQRPLTDLLEGDYDISYYQSEGAMAAQFLRPPPEIDLSLPGMSAGIIGLSDTFPNFDTVAARLYSSFRTHSKNLYMPEQAVFDLYFQTVEFRFLRLSEAYCTMPESPKAYEAFVVHSAGPKKFWNSIHSETWSRNYQVLRSHGLRGWSNNKVRRAALSRKIRYGLALGVELALRKKRT